MSGNIIDIDINNFYYISENKNECMISFDGDEINGDEINGDSKCKIEIVSDFSFKKIEPVTLSSNNANKK